MNLQDQVLYRCIHAACARPMPHRVNFCPWCGTGQHDGVSKPSHHPAPEKVVYQAPLAAPEPVPAPAPVPTPAPAAHPEPVMQSAAPPMPPPAPAPVKRAATTAVPPQRQPVRMRYWVMALAVLWLIWIFAKPTSKKIDARIEQAIALSEECRFSEAQGELIALRSTRATPEQLQRLQSAINKASSSCEKKRLRAKSWSDTTVAVEAALAAGEFAKAQSRLSQHTRRWGDNAEARELKAKITEQREALAAEPLPVRPAPAPVPEYRPVTPSSNADRAQSARNLINDAEREIARGNYKAASDKLELCATMVDAGNRECIAYKAYADRLLRERR